MTFSLEPFRSRTIRPTIHPPRPANSTCSASIMAPAALISPMRRRSPRPAIPIPTCRCGSASGLPPGLPQPIVDALHAKVTEIAELPETSTRLLPAGIPAGHLDARRAAGLPGSRNGKPRASSSRWPTSNLNETAGPSALRPSRVQSRRIYRSWAEPSGGLAGAT